MLYEVITHRRRGEDVGRQIIGLHLYVLAVDLHRSPDAEIFQKIVVFADKVDLEAAVFVAPLVIIAVAPQYAHTYHILPQVVGASHVRARQETQTARVDLERLV